MKDKLDINGGAAVIIVLRMGFKEFKMRFFRQERSQPIQV